MRRRWCFTTHVSVEICFHKLSSACHSHFSCHEVDMFGHASSTPTSAFLSHCILIKIQSIMSIWALFHQNIHLVNTNNYGTKRNFMHSSSGYGTGESRIIFQ